MSDVYDRLWVVLCDPTPWSVNSGPQITRMGADTRR
jgi:hypothetical protein